jgi:glycosyltransferase involved in cell wall biosynthesis
MLKGSSDQNYYPMTVVIATLGGETLKRTIEHLNCSTVVASEILVCIPRQEAVRAKALKFSNVKVVETPCRGQVAQRAFGFKSASFEIVMQLDDDIEVQNNAVELLLETLKNNEPNVAVAPVLLEKQPSYAQVMNKTVRKL